MNGVLRSVDIISKIISCTSPRDACRLSVVSPLFRSAAYSDLVWERFLPNDYKDLISNTLLLTEFSLSLLSKKDIYFYLCKHPIVFDNDNMSFAIHKKTGKRCYMIGAGRLSIIWGDDSKEYWVWPCLPESRFNKVAELRVVWWLEVTGRFKINLLSPKTTYVINLVFKFAESRRGFEDHDIEFRIVIERQGYEKTCNMRLAQSHDRGDGWKEIEMGEFTNENDDDGEVVCSLKEVDNSNPKSGLIIEGMEFRPKASA